MNTKSNVIKSVVGFSLPTWINAAIGIVTIPLLTRLFEPAVLGKINLFCTYNTILYCIALAGLNQGYMRFFHEPSGGKNTSGGLFRISLILVLIFSLLIGVVILIGGSYFSEAIAGYYDFALLCCLIVSVISAAMLTIVNSEYRMKNLIVAYGILAVIMNFCAKISYAGAVFFENQFFAAVLLLSASYAVVAIIYTIRELVATKGEVTVIGTKEIFPLLKYSLPLMPVLFIAQINTALPKLVINQYLDYAQVGIYSSAYSIVSIISLVQSGINTFWTPFVYEHYSDHPQYLLKGHSEITFILSVFGLLVILFQDVIYLVIGPAYRSSQEFFALLLFSPICYTISETTGIGINISKKTYLNIIINTVTILATFTLCYFFIPKYELIGAAIAVAIAAFVMLVLKTVIGERYYKVVNNYRKSLFSPLCLLVAAAVNTVFFSSIAIRSCITVFAMALLCFIYRTELLWSFKMARELVSKNHMRNK